VGQPPLLKLGQLTRAVKGDTSAARPESPGPAGSRTTGGGADLGALSQRALRTGALSRAAIVLLTLLLACAPPEPKATELLEKGAQKVAAASSVHFALLRVGEPIVLDPTTGLRLTEAVGDLKAPDRVRAKAKVLSPAGALTLDVLWLPEGAFVSNPFTGGFTMLPVRPSFDPSALVGAGGVPGILRSSQNATTVAKEKLAGVDAHHVRAEADGSKLSALTGGVVISGTHKIDVWVDAATFQVLRLIAAEPGGTASWRLDLSDYDKPVEIGRP